MCDQEEQDNELIALEAIYDARQFVRSTDEPGGELRVYIQLEEPFLVVFKSIDEGTKHLEDMLVKHLPPIILSFSYPPDYPSTYPPLFALSCKWLNTSQLSILCKQLDALWENGGVGSVIMFEWMSFLTDDAKSLLGIVSPWEINDVEIQRSKSFGAKNLDIENLEETDCRAFQDVASLAEVHCCLEDFDHNEKQRQFSLNVYACGVCFLEKLGDKCISFYPCSHVYCNDCMSEYFSVKIRDGAVKALTCPFEKCNSQAFPNQVRDLVDADIYDKYEKFLLQSSLDCMSDIIYCPRELCQSPVLLESGSSMEICAKCSFAFCIICKRSYHGVAPCPFDEKELKKLRKTYASAGPAERDALEKQYGRKNLKFAVEEAFSEDWIEKNSKKCPYCKALIQKIDGCNKMTCFRCHGYFCWLCQKRLSKSSPYSHFNNTQSACFNRLFEGVLIAGDLYEDEIEF